MSGQALSEYALFQTKLRNFLQPIKFALVSLEMSTKNFKDFFQTYVMAYISKNKKVNQRRIVLLESAYYKNIF